VVFIQLMLDVMLDGMEYVSYSNATLVAVRSG
jgi:hypothetical protein